MGGFIAEHRPYIIFALVVGAIGIVLGKVLHPKGSGTVKAGQGTDAATPSPVAEYIPTTTSFITETASAINSNNTAAPGAPVTVASPTTDTSNTTTGPVTTTTNTTGPVTTTTYPTPPQTTNPTPQTNPTPTVSGYQSALEARNHLGDTAIVNYFQQYKIPGWVGMWFVAEKWRLPASTQELTEWLNQKGLRDPNTGHFTGLISSASVPENAEREMSAAYAKATGGAMPRGMGHTGAPLRPNSGGAVPGHHVVRAGQTIQDVARMHGKDWQHVYSQNKDVIDSVSASHGDPLGSPWNALFPGTKLRIHN